MKKLIIFLFPLFFVSIGYSQGTYSWVKVKDSLNLDGVFRHNTANLIIIAGQSNANGRALNANLPSYLQGNQPAYVYYPGEFQVLNATATNNNQYNGASSNFGAEMELAYRYYQTSGDSLYILKFAISGSELAQNAGDDWNISTADELYDSLKYYITDAISLIEADGKTVNYLGMLWYQGEADAKVQSYADAYGVNQYNFFNGIRAYVGEPLLPIYDVRVSPHTVSGYGYTSTVKTAKDSVSEQLSNVYMIDVDSLLYSYKTDSLHLDYVGQLKLGNHVANLIGGGDAVWDLSDNVAENTNSGGVKINGNVGIQTTPTDTFALDIIADSAKIRVMPNTAGGNASIELYEERDVGMRMMYDGGDENLKFQSAGGTGSFNTRFSFNRTNGYFRLFSGGLNVTDNDIGVLDHKIISETSTDGEGILVKHSDNDAGDYSGIFFNNTPADNYEKAGILNERLSAAPYTRLHIAVDNDGTASNVNIADAVMTFYPDSIVSAVPFSANNSFGEMYDPTGTPTCDGTNYETVTGWTAGSYNASTVDFGDSAIIINQNGTYLVNGSYSVTCNVNVTIVHVSAFVNGVEATNIECERRVGTASDTGNTGHTGLISITNAPDTVYVRTKTDKAATVTFNHANFNLTRIK